MDLAAGEGLTWLLLAVFVVAGLYSSVGHAGASGYIALMTLAGLPPQTIKPIALTLNILVALIGTVQFLRAGHFRWALFWPFALLSVPLAFAGGYVQLPTAAFKVLLGIVLLYSALHLLLRPPAEHDVVEPSPRVAVPTGGALGLLAGLTGTGGGIFLTPLLLLLHWARAKHAAAVSAAFILVNSSAGLLGNLSSTRSFPVFGLALLVAAAAGGFVGSYLGSRRLDPAWIKRALALVLVIAGLKLLATT